jgi:hypothetical protein
MTRRRPVLLGLAAPLGPRAGRASMERQPQTLTPQLVQLRLQQRG